MGVEGDYRPSSREDFDRLYRTAYPRVYRTMSAILGDPDEAEDCTQDAFVQAFQAWKRWRPDAPAEAWVHRIAVNRAISYRRRARLRSVGELVRRLGKPARGIDPGDLVTRPDLLTALRSIPPRLAAAIVLRHYHGYNNREIAAAIGVSERTVAPACARRQSDCATCSSRPSHLIVLRRYLQIRMRAMPSAEQNPLGAGFEWRLRAALNRVVPPGSPPRYQSVSSPARPLRLAPLVLAVALTGILSVTASAASGSPNPVVWTQKATSVIRTLSHVPTNVATPQQAPRPAPSRPAAVRPVAAAPHAAPAHAPEHQGWPRPEPTGHPEGSTPPDQSLWPHDGGGGGSHDGSSGNPSHH